MRAAKPSAQFLGLGLNVKHGLMQGRERRSGGASGFGETGLKRAAGRQREKQSRTYIQRRCGAARALPRLVIIVSFITWMDFLTWMDGRTEGWMDGWMDGWI